MRVIKNPVVQFLAAGVLALVVVVLATGRLSQSAASAESVADARARTELLARSVAEPAIPPGMVAGGAGALDRFDRTVRRRLLVGDVRRVKIWTRDGRIVYSDVTALIGNTYTLGADELRVLADGGSDAEVSDLGRRENRYEVELGGLLEVYTRIRSPEGEPLLFEAYFSASDIADRKQEVLSAFRPITLGGLLLFLILTTPLVWALTRRVRRAADVRELLLRAAVDASDAERRRIARDLHDGVVQDLAGTAFALSAAARTGEPSTHLEQMAVALRKSLRSLRSLLVEIYPPDLHTNGLEAALEDLVAPAAGAGVQVAVEVTGFHDVSDDVVALVWRVAQEAVRNALRHGAPSEIQVRADADDCAVRLQVHDNGSGFEPDAPPEQGRFGLRGLHDLIREAGGTIQVRSAPGSGTTVSLEVTRP